MKPPKPVCADCLNEKCKATTPPDAVVRCEMKKTKKEGEK